MTDWITIIFSSGEIAVAIALVYFTYTLASHTLLLSKIQITPKFEDIGQGTYRIPEIKTDFVEIHFRNIGNGRAINLECSYRINDQAEQTLKAIRRIIEPSGLFQAEIGAQVGQKIEVRLKYNDIMNPTKKPYEQLFEYSF